MRAVLIVPALVLLAGCMGSGDLEGQVREETTRAVARTAVNAAVASYLPGVNAAPLTDCVIDNADTAELLVLGQAGATAMLGDTAAAGEQAWPVTRNVLSRPAAAQCLGGALSSSEILMLGRGML